jgi:hypothetical protein
MSVKLMETYQKALEHTPLASLGISVSELRETMMHKDFSIQELYTSILKEGCEGRLKETAEGTFGSLLRLGVQAMSADFFAWAGGDTVYQDLVDERPSNKYAEFYAPMYGGQLPKPVERSGRYASSYFKGTDSMIVNLKFGRLYEFEQELWEDDKTGQIRQKAQQIGEGMRIVQEMWSLARLTGMAQTYPEDITVPEPQVLTTVYDKDLFGPGLGNRAQAALTRLSQPALEEASISMMKVRDPLKNRILAKMDTLVVSVDDMFTAAKLINSTLQPSMPGTAAQVMGGTSVAAGPNAGVPGGTVGYVNTINPLYGLYKLKVARYLPSKHWYLGQAKKGLIFQNREPLSIVQENPAAGESFARDILVFRSKARWEVDWIEGSNLFWYQGYYA